MKIFVHFYSNDGPSANILSICFVHYRRRQTLWSRFS